MTEPVDTDPVSEPVATPRPGRRRVALAAAVVVVVAVAGAAGVLMMRPTSGGPLGAGDAGVVVDGFAAGTVVTYGLQTLGNTDQEHPIVLESVQVRVGDPGVELLGDPLLLGPERVQQMGAGSFDVLEGWPPAQAPVAIPVAGAVIPAGQTSQYEVVVPLRVPAQGVGVVEGFTVTYEASGRRYREVTDMVLVLCPTHDAATCREFDPGQGLESLRD